MKNIKAILIDDNDIVNDAAKSLQWRLTTKVADAVTNSSIVIYKGQIVKNRFDDCHAPTYK